MAASDAEGRRVKSAKTIGKITNWHNLHSDLLILIAQSVKDVRDHLAFAAVCSSWREAALEVRPTFTRPVPGLMLSGPQLPLYFSLSEGRCYQDRIRLLYDDDECFGSHGGWLFILHPYPDSTISLFNPFSRERLRLPSFSTIPMDETACETDDDILIKTAALSSQNISTIPADAAVMIVHGEFRKLAVAKLGDCSWRSFENDPGEHTGVLFYRGQFYVVGNDSMIVCDIELNPKFTSVAALPPRDCNLSYYSKMYLVELMGGLVLVERLIDTFDGEYPDSPERGILDVPPPNNIYDNYGEGEASFDVEEFAAPALDVESWYRTMSFRLYRMDFANRQWVQVKDLKDHVIFISFNSAFSMLASGPLEGDCIYFTDDSDYAYCTRNDEIGNYGYDMGVFNVKNGVVKPHTGDRKKLFPPPMWVTYLPW